MFTLQVNNFVSFCITVFNVKHVMLCSKLHSCLKRTLYARREHILIKKVYNSYSQVHVGDARECVHPVHKGGTL